MSAIAGVAGDLYVTASPSTSLGGTPEGATDQGDHIHYFTNTHQFWDPTQTLTIQYSPNGSTGWTTDSSGDYTFYYPVGEIVFTSARTPGTNNFIRVSAGYYFSASQLVGAHNWKLSMKGQTKDVTPFQASGSWAVNLGTIKNASGSIDAYKQDGQLLTEMNNTSNALIGLQLWYYETGGYRWQCFANVTGVQEVVDAHDVDKQTINFQVYGPMYQITSNSLSSTTVTQM